MIAAILCGSMGMVYSFDYELCENAYCHDFYASARGNFPRANGRHSIEFDVVHAGEYRRAGRKDSMRENARTRTIDNNDIASRSSRDRADQAMQVIAYCASRAENLSRL